MEESIVVEAPRPSVWFTLLRFGHYPAWMEGVHEVTKTGDTTLHWRATVAGDELEWDAEIVSMLDDQVLEWHARDDGPNDVRITLEEVSGNCTRVTIVDRFRPQGVLARIATAVGMGKLRLRRDLENLKRQVESTSRVTA
jgi:uncharacterized membrane protein